MTAAVGMDRLLVGIGGSAEGRGARGIIRRQHERFIIIIGIIISIIIGFTGGFVGI